MNSTSERMMKFYRETWWMWVVYLAICIAMALTTHLLFLACIPWVIGISLYFAFVRSQE